MVPSYAIDCGTIYVIDRDRIDQSVIDCGTIYVIDHGMIYVIDRGTIMCD
jgi:hypothetical protein